MLFKVSENKIKSFQWIVNETPVHRHVTLTAKCQISPVEHFNPGVFDMGGRTYTLSRRRRLRLCRVWAKGKWFPPYFVITLGENLWNKHMFFFFLPSLRLIRNFKNVLHFHADKTVLSDSFEHKGPFLDARVCVCDGFCATETSRTLFFLWAARLWCSASLLSGACQG